MTGALLDISSMPFERTYICKDGTIIDVRDHLDRHYVAIQELAGAKLIKDNPSFGFAMATPRRAQQGVRGEYWDDPQTLVWLVGGWGNDRDRYIANAVRKLRPLLRPVAWGGALIESTLAARFHTPHHFQDMVESQNADGTFSWGDFPRGGAVSVQVGPLVLPGAISCLHEIEDDYAVRLVLGGLGKRIVIGDELLPVA